MEKMLKAYDKEHMKMAMLKHEEIFKQQVYELHRLYRVQKILMKGVEGNKSKKPNQQRLNYSSENSLHQTNESPHNYQKKSRPDINLDINGNLETEIEDETEIQLTLGPTKYNLKKKIEKSDSGTSFSSSSTGSSHIINGANESPYEYQENLAWGLTMVTTDSNSGYHNTIKNAYQVRDQSTQGRLNRPSWCLQALSLNMS